MLKPVENNRKTKHPTHPFQRLQKPRGQLGLKLSNGIQSPQVSHTSSPVTELAPTLRTGAEGGGGAQGQKLLPQHSAPQPAEAAGCHHYFPLPQTGIRQGSNMP